MAFTPVSRLNCKKCLDAKAFLTLRSLRHHNHSIRNTGVSLTKSYKKDELLTQQKTDSYGLRNTHSLSGQGGSRRLDFSDFEQAFKGKDIYDLTRAMLVYKICSFHKLIDYNKQLISFSRNVLGKRGFDLLMKSTFYGHFVAGEDQAQIKGKLDLMQKYGVGAILDYAVEADMPEEEKEERCKEEVERKEVKVTDLSDVYHKYRVHRKFHREEKVWFCYVMLLSTFIYIDFRLSNGVRSHP